MSRPDHYARHAGAKSISRFSSRLSGMCWSAMERGAILLIVIALCTAIAVGDASPFANPAGLASASLPAQGAAEPAANPAQATPPADHTPVSTIDPGATPEAETGAADSGETIEGEEIAPTDTFDPTNPFDLTNPGTSINAAAASPYGLLLPDSEFVYGPTLYGFDTVEFVNSKAGFLSRHLEIVEGQTLIGGQIVERVALDYSLGPRMLLTIIELRSGWVTQAQPALTTDPLKTGAGGGPSALYNGLVEAAEVLQTLYYANRLDDVRTFPLGDGQSVTLIARNPGTWAISAWLSRGVNAETWGGLEAQSRFWTAWAGLFGDDPYANQTTEILPPGALRSPLRLPFTDGAIWYFAEGPTSPRGAGAARASVAFAPPPAQAGGCLQSFEPVLAVAGGNVIRSEDRGVVLDLDTDEFEGSGWNIVYRHINPEGRVGAGTRVSAGDLLGYPACIDGEAGLNRVRIARKYHGEWIPADRADSPWVMGGWIITQGALPGQGSMTLPGLAQRQNSLIKSDPVNGIAALPGR